MANGASPKPSQFTIERTLARGCEGWTKSPVWTPRRLRIPSNVFTCKTASHRGAKAPRGRQAYSPTQSGRSTTFLSLSRIFENDCGTMISSIRDNPVAVDKVTVRAGWGGTTPNRRREAGKSSRRPTPRRPQPRAGRDFRYPFSQSGRTIGRALSAAARELPLRCNGYRASALLPRHQTIGADIRGICPGYAQVPKKPWIFGSADLANRSSA